MATTLLQWNCRGLRNNFNEVQLLAQRYDPQAICLQETLLQDTDSIDFRGYNLLNTYSGNGPNGGSSIMEVCVVIMVWVFEDVLVYANVGIKVTFMFTA
jgi:exonuclease III